MRPHTLDPVSLVFGLFFVGAGGWVLLDGTGRGIPDTRWILPVLLLVTGVAVLASVIAATGAASTDRAAGATDGEAEFAGLSTGRHPDTPTEGADPHDPPTVVPEADDEPL